MIAVPLTITLNLLRMRKYLRSSFSYICLFLNFIIFVQKTRVSTILNHYILQISRFCGHSCSFMHTKSFALDEKRIKSAHLSV